MDHIEEKICQIIEEQKERIIAFGRDIWEHAEVGFHEVRTAEKFTQMLRAAGVSDIEEGIALTGVKGSLSGNRQDVTIALMGELDALPMPNHPAANPETGAAHACGHHAQITAVAGAALALAHPEIRDTLDGNLVFVGVPNEESVNPEEAVSLAGDGKLVFGYGGGKREFLVQGKLQEVDMVLGHHAIVGNVDGDISVSFGSANGFVNKTVTYHGRSAHSAGAPHRGLDAFAAANLAIHAIDLQRESFREKDCVRIHGNLLKNAPVSNIIAEEVVMQYGVRGKTMAAIEDASDKFDRSIRAGAVASGCGATIQTTMGYFPVTPTLDKELLIEAVNQVAEESGYRSSIQREMQHSPGATDYGDMTMVMPLLYFETGGFDGANHSNEFHPVDEYLAYVVPAKVFALTAYKLLRNGAIGAREVIEGYTAPMSQEQYCTYCQNAEHTEEIPQAPLPLVEEREK